jgi:hypothetical protein
MVSAECAKLVLTKRPTSKRPRKEFLTKLGMTDDKFEIVFMNLEFSNFGTSLKQSQFSPQSSFRPTGLVGADRKLTNLRLLCRFTLMAT